MDAERLHSDIRSQLREDPISAEHLDNQSDPKWTFNPMVYYPTLDASMFQIPEISNYVFFSTRTTTPFQVISVRRRPTSSPYAILLVRTSSLRQGLLQIVHHLFPCQTCAPQTYRLLKQLPIPEKPWNSISMDFIEKLLPSSSYTSILVIFDHLSKQSLFILTHDPLHHPNLHNSSFYMSFQARCPSHVTSITVWNSYHTSSGPSELHWT